MFKRVHVGLVRSLGELLWRRRSRDTLARGRLGTLKLRRQLIQSLFELSDPRPLGSLLDPRRGRRAGEAIFLEPMASVVAKESSQPI